MASLPIRPNLLRFSRQIAARLPGVWTAAAHRPDPNEPDQFSEVWDSQMLEWATAEFDASKSAVLTSSNGDRLLAMAHPRRRADFIVGALAPPGLRNDPVGDEDAPLAIIVPSDAVRAATVITRRFLPRYDEAVARLRLTALADALDGADQALAEWDAVSDSLCGPDGWPLDADAYGEHQSQRDAVAWQHMQTFLFHGPAVLADARAAMHGLAVGPQVAADWRWRLGALEAALEGGRRVRAEWEAAHPVPPGRLDVGERQQYADGVAERDADGWHYAHEFIVHGPALLDIARVAGATHTDDQVHVTVRAEAARARSTTAPVRAHTAARAESPPSHPVLDATSAPRAR
jgi:hypothetical protein